MKKLALIAMLALTALISFNVSAAPASSGNSPAYTGQRVCTWFNGVMYCVIVPPPGGGHPPLI